VTSYEPFLDGFLPGPRDSLPGGWEAGRIARGRPVDVLQLPDGSVLISDDTGNRILRVTYRQ
jgi:glucose/arabinose dehydrogenase